MADSAPESHATQPATTQSAATAERDGKFTQEQTQEQFDTLWTKLKPYMDKFFADPAAENNTTDYGNMYHYVYAFCTHGNNAGRQKLFDELKSYFLEQSKSAIANGTSESAHERFEKSVKRVVGVLGHYRRTWMQRELDERGAANFPKDITELAESQWKAASNT